MGGFWIKKGGFDEPPFLLLSTGLRQGKVKLEPVGAA
jgi:hypothetical protein